MIKRIVVSGGWGYGNIGDEAILKYTYLDLKKTFPNTEIYVLSFDKNVTEYHHPFSSADNLHRTMRTHAGKNLINDCKEIIKKKAFKDYLKDYINLFDRHTLFVMAGGGYFNDHWEESFYVHMAEIVTAKERNAKVAIIGQTIGPISGNEHLSMFSKIINMVDYLDVRDKTSFDLISGILPNKTVHLSCDAVIRNGMEQNKSNGKKMIGIMFQRKRPYTKPGTSKMKYRMNQAWDIFTGKSKSFTKKFCTMIKKISSSYPDYEIVFLQSTDWRIREINKIKQKCGVKKIYLNCRVDEYISFINNCSVVLTTNMHPAILATTVGVPAIAISHTYKIDDYMNSCGMNKYIFHEMDEKGIEEALFNLLNNNNITKNLLEKNSALVSKLDETYDNLRKECEKGV